MNEELNEKLEDVWARDLANLCAEVLADSVEYGQMVKVHSLYYEIYPIVNEMRLGSNIRGIVDDDKKLDLLLDLLRKEIDKLENEGKSLSDDFRAHDLGAILAVTFSGIIAARLDSNFQNMEVICEWCDRVSGERTKGYSIMEAADCYHIFGSFRGEVSKDEPKITLPTEGKLDDIIRRAEEECRSAEVKDKNEYIRQLRLFLLDAVMQLPPYRQDKLRDYQEFLDLSSFKGSKETKPARMFYNLSKVSYAKGDKKSLDHALEYAVSALQYAKPEDVTFIELCRQNLLILEQEKAAREVTKKEALKQAQQDFEEIITEKKSELDEMVQKELKDSLLRVIEILGIFLAVAGAGVTAVGGIAVSDSFLDALGIYLGGTLSVVILFGLLRLMVLKPLVLARKKNRWTETPQAPEPTDNNQKGE